MKPFPHSHQFRPKPKLLIQRLISRRIDATHRCPNEHEVRSIIVMASLKTWYYGRGRAMPAAAAADNMNKTTSTDHDSTSELSPLRDVTEMSRAAAVGTSPSGGNYSDMASRDGVGALVAFDSEVCPTAAATADEAASELLQNNNRVSLASNGTGSNAVEVDAPLPPEEPADDFLLDAMGDVFGAVLIDETQAAVVAEEAASSTDAYARKSRDITATCALYPEVAQWLVVETDSETAAIAGVTERQASETKNCNNNSRKPSLYQRIDRYLFPPSKLIVDGTLLPSNSRANGDKLEVDFPRDGRQRHKRERRLIGTGLGSAAAAAVGVVSHRASANAVSLATPPTLRSSQVLLWGATTVDAHYQQIRHVLETSRGMHGVGGLRAVGFEYRVVKCPSHASSDEEVAEQLGDDEEMNARMDGLEGRNIHFITKSNSQLNDSKRSERVQMIIRSQSDACVPYGGSGSLNGGTRRYVSCKSPSSHDHHNMIIVPSHATNVGDLVESAAIRERKVRGFADSGRESRMMSVSSDTSLSTVFCNSDSDDEYQETADCQEKDKGEAEVMGGGKGISVSPAEAAANGEILGPDDVDNADHCFECFTRLFHIQSNTMLTEDNLNRYIAHGDMYDEIARMCQEHAQVLMMEAGDLRWVTICDDSTKGNPVRALVDSDHSKRPGPILLVVTGKGKVRAGIFSRRHILTTGIECSTALPMVREAKRRKMRVALLDPNARGDREGMATFETSVRALFGHQEWEKDDESEGQGPYTSEYFNPHRHPSPMYVLAHSASGAQLVRYLLDQAHHLLPRIAAIVFTDSTHNIQWTKKHDSLQRLLESPACVYVRSASIRNDDNYQTCRAGDAVDTDHHWRRRFGTVRTVWAGTAEHSLMNWTSHHQIWAHFDQHILPSVYQGVAKLQDAMDESMHDNDDHIRKLPHKKRERSVDIVTL